MTAADVIQQTQHKMGVTVEKLRDDFTRIRTGRASTGLLDKIRVDYYGCPTPLNQVAQVGVGDAHTLTVQPWETNMVKNTCTSSTSPRRNISIAVSAIS